MRPDAERLLRRVVAAVADDTIDASFATPPGSAVARLRADCLGGERTAVLRTYSYVCTVTIPELDVLACTVEEDDEEWEAAVSRLAAVALAYLQGGGHVERRRRLFWTTTVLTLDVGDERWRLGRRWCSGPDPC